LGYSKKIYIGKSILRVGISSKKLKKFGRLLVQMTKAGRLAFIPDQVIMKTWKTALVHCQALCSVLMDGCKKTVHIWQCDWLAINAAFTNKVAVQPMVQASRDGQNRSLMTLLKEYRKL